MRLPYPESNLGYLSPVSLVVQGLSTRRSKSWPKEPSQPLVSLLDGDALRNVTPTPQTLREHKDGYLHHLLHQGLVGAGLSTLQAADVLANPCDEGELGPLAHRIPRGEAHEGKQSDVICTNSKRRAWCSVRTPRSTLPRRGSEPQGHPERHRRSHRSLLRSQQQSCRRRCPLHRRSGRGGGAEGPQDAPEAAQAEGAQASLAATPATLPSPQTVMPQILNLIQGAKGGQLFLSQIFEALFGTGKPHNRETGTEQGLGDREQRQWPCFWPGIQLGAPWAFLDCGQTIRPIKNSEHFSTRCVVLVTWGVCVCVCACACMRVSPPRHSGHLGLGGSSWWGRLVHWRTEQQPWPPPPPCQ